MEISILSEIFFGKMRFFGCKLFGKMQKNMVFAFMSRGRMRF